MCKRNRYSELSIGNASYTLAVIIPLMLSRYSTNVKDGETTIQCMLRSWQNEVKDEHGLTEFLDLTLF